MTPADLTELLLRIGATLAVVGLVLMLLTLLWRA